VKDDGDEFVWECRGPLSHSVRQCGIVIDQPWESFDESMAVTSLWCKMVNGFFLNKNISFKRGQGMYRLPLFGKNSL